MAAYAAYALEQEAFDFPFNIPFCSIKEKLQSLVERAAELGDANSQYLIARQLEQNDKDEEAVVWYEKAAEQGESRSIFCLANYYEEIDYQKSIYWYRKAVELDNDDFCAPYSIAELIIRNDESPDSFAEAVKWYEKAFALGDDDAAIQLAKIYFKGGYGVEQDYAKSAEWTIIAAEDGDIEAITELCHMYEKGLGVEKNQKEAEKWRKVLADYEAEFDG
jgi:TPR repeat protein